MAGIDKMLARIKKANHEQITEKSIRQHTFLFTILNKLRLYNTGLDIHGKPIRTFKAVPPNVYSYFTIAKKREKRQPINRVTLKDSGRFYKTIKALVRRKWTKMSAVFKKGSGSILDNVDREGILGLGQNDKKHMTEKLTPTLRTNYRKALKI